VGVTIPPSRSFLGVSGIARLLKLSALSDTLGLLGVADHSQLDLPPHLLDLAQYQRGDESCEGSLHSLLMAMNPFIHPKRGTGWLPLEEAITAAEEGEGDEGRLICNLWHENRASQIRWPQKGLL